jgi:hypothetical protein
LGKQKGGYSFLQFNGHPLLAFYIQLIGSPCDGLSNSRYTQVNFHILSNAISPWTTAATPPKNCEEYHQQSSCQWVKLKHIPSDNAERFTLDRRKDRQTYVGCRYTINISEKFYNDIRINGINIDFRKKK